MARGWGRSEEDQAAEKEHAGRSLAGTADRPSRGEIEAAARRRGIELSLARIEDELAKTAHPLRRSALEAARTELRARLASEAPGAGSD